MVSDSSSSNNGLQTPSPDPRRVARVMGWLGVLAFAGTSTIRSHYFIDFHPPFASIGSGEANLWLSSALLLFPACCVLGYGYGAPLGRALFWLHAQLQTLTPRDKKLGLVCLGMFALASAKLSNALIMLGMPVTDDEWAARFGGEVLATGHLTTRLPFAREAFPALFTFIDGDRVSSLDWLGVQIPWAIATLTHSGNWVFAVLAALPVPCLAWLLARQLGLSWGVAGALLFLFSPMSFALSSSAHAHLSSRALIALTLLLYVLWRGQPSKRLSFAMGTALGLAITCRPFEVCSLMAPLFLAETYSRLKDGDRAARAHWGVLVLGLSLPLLVFFLHTYLLTGGLIPARHHPLAVGGQPTHEQSYWVRFGSNSAFNLLRLAVWFAGPLGIVLFVSGVLTSRFTRLLGLGILAALLVGLFHDNYGIHAVGPIHYSECVVPLTIISVHGLARLTQDMRRLGLSAVLPSALSATCLIVGLGLFNVLHGVGLHGQASIQDLLYAHVEEMIPQKQRPAVLFAPAFGMVWLSNEEFAQRGSWVFEWRKPRPDYSDEILILHAGSESTVASVRAAFPERHFYELHQIGDDKHYAIEPLP